MDFPTIAEISYGLKRRGQSSSSPRSLEDKVGCGLIHCLSHLHSDSTDYAKWLGSRWTDLATLPRREERRIREGLLLEPSRDLVLEAFHFLRRAFQHEHHHHHALKNHEKISYCSQIIGFLRSLEDRSAIPDHTSDRERACIRSSRRSGGSGGEGLSRHGGCRRPVVINKTLHPLHSPRTRQIIRFVKHRQEGDAGDAEEAEDAGDGNEDDHDNHDDDEVSVRSVGCCTSEDAAVSPAKSCSTTSKTLLALRDDDDFEEL